MSAVKNLAKDQGIAVQQPATLRDPSVQEALRDWPAEAWVVAAYGLLLPPPILHLAPLGCINVHASLLPRWRGAAPIQRALLAGDAETGVSIMRMDEGLDTGPVYMRRRVPIAADATAGSLLDCLAQVGAEALCEVLDQLRAGTARAEAQPAVGVTYARKLSREDARIDWSQPAAAIERSLRALDPVPGAYTVYRGETLKLWRGQVAAGEAEAKPGRVLRTGPEGIEVQCGAGSLRITVLQRPGGKRIAAADFLRGHRLDAGALLGAD
jgi:methionyl-tRNA formyltransferase